MRLVLAAILVLAATPALAQSSGTYAGTIACERMPGRAASNAPFQLTVEGAQARYAREVLAVDGSPMGLPEEATAPIAPDGMLTLAATIEAGSFHYESRYEGRLGEASGKLAGTQAWLVDKQRVARKCTISLNRRAASAAGPARGRPAQGKQSQEKPGQGKPGQGTPGQGTPAEPASADERPAPERPARARPARAQPRPSAPAEGRPGLDMNVPLDLPPPR
jgi:hypothetical protein